jgi:hypothetical protein
MLQLLPASITSVYHPQGSLEVTEHPHCLKPHSGPCIVGGFLCMTVIAAIEGLMMHCACYSCFHKILPLNIIHRALGKRWTFLIACLWIVAHEVLLIVAGFLRMAAIAPQMSLQRYCA